MPLSITEFADFARWSTNNVGTVGGLPPLAIQSVAVAAGSTQSAAFSASTRVIRVVSDTACAIAVGDNPTAVATDTLLPANVPEYFAVNPGQKLATITP